MEYNGYRIMAVETVSQARPVLEDGSMDINSLPINLEVGPGLSGFPEWFYGVVDEDDFLLQTFEELDEAKQYIDEEL
jgi:hypothetical protein